MKINKTTDKNNNNIIEVTYDQKKWKDIQKKYYEKATEKVKTPGFREGKSPKYATENKVDKSLVLRLSANDAVKDVTSEFQKNKENIPPKDHDSVVEILEATEEKLLIQFSYFKKPIFNINSINEIKIDVPKRPRINETELTKYMNEIVKSKAERIESEKPVEMGNVVNIDFEGYIGDKKFENGSAKNFNLEIGSNKFIPGFETQLIGMKKDEEKDIKVRFPKDYPSDDLRDKETIFKVKINSIIILKIPQLTNELIKELKIPNINDINGFKNYCKNSMMTQIINNYNQQISNLVVNQLLQKIAIDIPDKLKDLEVSITKSMFYDQAKQANMSSEDFAVRNGLSKTDYDKQLELIAINKVKLSYILREYIKENKIVISDDDYSKAYEEYKTKQPVGNQNITFLDFKARMLNDRSLSEIISVIVENSQLPSEKKVEK